MNTILEEQIPTATEEPKIINELDFQQTRDYAYRFHSDCLNTLHDWALKGNGYFLRIDKQVLKTAMQEAVNKEDWTTASNYAMMLYTQQRLDEEYEAWLNRETATS